ncbi:MAG: hypothetical protein ACR2GC_03100 [Methyloceanibacter sp.]|uniref:hypothetical protein n=1 Tax=Methyloceanibacter sp. TaxID=1965321 RepID=UPI003D9ADE27
MTLGRSIRLSIVAAALFVGSTAFAQAPGGSADHSAHHPGQQAEQPTPETKSNAQMMGGCPMMGKMGQGMMGQGMMSGTTQEGSRGMVALFGSRVTPMMNLSVDEVRIYLAAQIDRLGNQRLKVGDIKSDDGTITADVMTIDDSLVQRLKVNRHTGAIEYQN